MKISTFVLLMLTITALSSTLLDTRPKNREPASDVGPVTKDQTLRLAMQLLSSGPLIFERNQGQTDQRVSFLARGKGFRLFLTQNAMVFTLAPESAKAGSQVRSPEPITFQFKGANAVQPEGLEELPGKSNYFIGSHSVTHVHQYARVIYRALYPGIDLVFYSRQGVLEYDFVVAANADPSLIRMAVDRIAQEVVTLDHKNVTIGSLCKQKPDAFQNVQGVMQPIAASYSIARGEEISFRLGDYDRSRPLIIDPKIVMKRYLHASGHEVPYDAAVDAARNIIAVGMTDSVDFPVKSAFQKKAQGEDDAFVVKLNPAGQIVYSTYLGGHGFDGAYAVAVGKNGSAYMAGDTSATIGTSSDFPLKKPIFIFPEGVFLTKLSPNGDSLVYSTYLVGGRGAGAGAIAVRNGYAYVSAGVDRQSVVPIVHPIQSQPGGGSDPFLMEVNPSGTAVVFSTYIGGKGDDIAEGLTIDSSGCVYLAGGTHSSNFPVTADAYQSKPKNKGTDGFVTKIDVARRRLVYSTYLGGNALDWPTAISLDRFNNAIVTGFTHSRNFPTVNAVLRKALSAGNNIFVSKLNSTGSALIYSTYLGGGNGEDVVVDASGNAYVVAGSDYSCSLIIFNPIPGSPLCGMGSISKLDPSGSLLYSSYHDLGFSTAVTLGPKESVYVAGWDPRIDDIYVSRITQE